MKKNNKILKYYFIALIVIVCIFVLSFGTVSAQNNTRKSTKGSNQSIVTDKTINEFFSYFTI